MIDTDNNDISIQIGDVYRKVIENYWVVKYKIEGELSFDGYHWSIKYYDSNWESTRYYRTNPFTKLFKLGNIHEEG